MRYLLPRRNFRFVAAWAVVLCAITACAGAARSGSTPGGSAVGASQAGGPAPTRRDRTVISSADLREIPASNLYEVVQRLHADWLVARNSSTVGNVMGRAARMDSDIQVYIGSQRAGSIDVLKQLPTNGIESLKYLSASEAQGKFGNGNLNGVIQIIMTTK